MDRWIDGWTYGPPDRQTDGLPESASFSCIFTTGHNIVADRLGGAYKPHPYSPPPHANSHTHTSITAAS